MYDLILKADNAAADFMLGIQNGFLTPLLKIVTYATEKGILWIAIGLFLLLYKPTRRFGIVYAVSLFCAFMLSEYVLKFIVCRERPFIMRDDIKLLISAPSGYSFPSSHSCSSFACAVSIFLKKKKIGIAALVFAFVVGFSRVYFTVHWLTDVLVGAVIGTLCAVLVYAVFEYIRKRRNAQIC